MKFNRTQPGPLQNIYSLQTHEQVGNLLKSWLNLMFASSNLIEDCVKGNPGSHKSKEFVVKSQFGFASDLRRRVGESSIK